MFGKKLSRYFYLANRARLYLTRPFTVGARVVLIRDDAVVLVRHSYRPGWYIPGGGVKRGETFEEAVRREAQEEVGAELGSLEFIGMYSNFNEFANDHVAVFGSRDFCLENVTSSEIDDMQMFSLKNLPEDVSPGSKRRIEDYLSFSGQPVVSRW